MKNRVSREIKETAVKFVLARTEVTAVRYWDGGASKRFITVFAPFSRRLFSHSTISTPESSPFLHHFDKPEHFVGSVSFAARINDTRSRRLALCLWENLKRRRQTREAPFRERRSRDVFVFSRRAFFFRVSLSRRQTSFLMSFPGAFFLSHFFK